MHSAAVKKTMKKYKVQFHAHSGSDPEDCLFHSEKDLINKAHSFNYDVLAITCHNHIAHTKELKDYAAKKGILLIPGVEKTVEKNHVVILNAKDSALKINTFDDLRKYKNENQDSLIFAAHPYHPFPLGVVSLGKNLDKNIDLFDAIEFSSFHTPKFDFNKKAVKTAKAYNKPMLGTSDNHVLSFLNHTFSYVYADEKNPEAIFDSIKKGKIEIVSKPMNAFRIAGMTTRLIFLEYARKFLRLFIKKNK